MRLPRMKRSLRGRGREAVRAAPGAPRRSARRELARNGPRGVSFWIREGLVVSPSCSTTSATSSCVNGPVGPALMQLCHTRLIRASSPVPATRYAQIGLSEAPQTGVFVAPLPDRQNLRAEVHRLRSTVELEASNRSASLRWILVSESSHGDAFGGVIVYRPPAPASGGICR